MFSARLTEEQSANADALRRYDKLLAASMAPVEEHLSAIRTRIGEGRPHWRRPANRSRRPKRVTPAIWRG